MTLLSEKNNPKFEAKEEEPEPKNIALAIFRFKARRGIGVFYTLLAIVPIVVAILEELSAQSDFLIVSVGLVVFGILLLARWAGMKRFSQMSAVMALFEKKERRENWELKLKRTLDGGRIVLFTLFPLLATAVFDATNSAVLGSGVLAAFVSIVLGYYFLAFSRQPADMVLPWRIEDSLVLIIPTLLLLLSFFEVIGLTTYLVSILLLLLLAGLKSSFEAPQSLVEVMGTNDDFRSEVVRHSKEQEAISLSALTSGGPLSNFTRVGIMITLLGVEEITFTELMIAVKVSKSSLNHSVNALADAGFVNVRRGFKTAGGPRTFIEITRTGEETIRSHLENMQTLASKFLT